MTLKTYVVAFSGAACSGKSSIAFATANLLEIAGYRVKLIGEVAREVFKKYETKHGVKSIEELRKTDYVKEFQLDVLRAQVGREIAAYGQYDFVVCDRTIYDNLLYTIIACSDDSEFLDRYISEFVESKRLVKYDLIFLCEPVNTDCNDGFRATKDIDTRKLQHEMLKLMLPQYVILPDIGVSERIRIVKSVIETLFRVVVDPSRG